MTLADSEMVEEIESWRRFADALRAEDRELFREMIRLCYEYIPAMEAKASPFPSEPLFMSLLFLQHKTIARLTREIERLKGQKDARLDS
ncbi:MAG: hypothetical protein JRM80_06585 [Nitrososphaerota archaeon]|nr:hypothetical protein [Nitrososphaerota archaeon]